MAGEELTTFTSSEDEDEIDLFETAFPTAANIGLNVFHLMGRDIETLSASQLEMLKEIHENQVREIIERQLYIARNQGIIQGEEALLRKAQLGLL